MRIKFTDAELTAAIAQYLQSRSVKKLKILHVGLEEGKFVFATVVAEP